MEEKIRQVVGKALVERGLENVPFVVERPGILEHGDYTTNAAMVAHRLVKDAPSGGPRAFAEELAAEIKNALPEAQSVLVAGPGFINITLLAETVHGFVAEADAKGEAWGRGESKAGQRVLVEYTDPNPFKEMHIGHLMNNITGEAVSRLIESQGATVARANYQGDVGPHVAKALWGLKCAGVLEPTTAKEIGEAYVAGAQAYKDSPEAKAEIDAMNVALYQGADASLLALWHKGRAVSLEAFERLYRILGTHFDYYFFESETANPGLRIVRDGMRTGVFEESEGAVIYRGEKKGLQTLVFITSRGTPTYEAKEIGLAFLKEERVASDESLIVTAAEQIGHFKVVQAALQELAPLIARKTVHIPHGLLRFVGGKMSSRDGNVISAEALIRDVTEKAAEKNPDALIAEQVALAAVKYMILRQSPGQDIIFDREKSLSLEGDSGPYLQYALVRAYSVLEKVEHAGGNLAEGAPPFPYELSRVLIHFPNVARRAARELSPNILVTYLTELAGAWNSFYAKERIMGGKYEAHKLMLVRAFAATMQNGLTLLGMPILKKM